MNEKQLAGLPMFLAIMAIVLGLLSFAWFLLEVALYGYSQPSNVDTAFALATSYFIADRIMRAVWRS